MSLTQYLTKGIYRLHNLFYTVFFNYVILFLISKAVLGHHITIIAKGGWSIVNKILGTPSRMFNFRIGNNFFNDLVIQLQSVDNFSCILYIPIYLGICIIPGYISGLGNFMSHLRSSNIFVYKKTSLFARRQTIWKALFFLTQLLSPHRLWSHP